MAYSIIRRTHISQMTMQIVACQRPHNPMWHSYKPSSQACRPLQWASLTTGLIWPVVRWPRCI